jgi:YHS domain-containing protein
MVRLRPGAVLVNLATIVGIPLVGGCLGFLVPAWMGLEFTARPGIALALLGTGLLLGIATSVSVYRRYSVDHQPYISRVIRPAPALQATAPAPTMDPVCRQPVEPAKAKGRIGYQGETYYFAHQDCLQAFLKDPRRYV